MPNKVMRLANEHLQLSTVRRRGKGATPKTTISIFKEDLERFQKLAEQADLNNGPMFSVLLSVFEGQTSG